MFANQSPMNRVTTIQKIINKKKGGAYLEIGVLAGDTFLRIKASHKLGVDTNFEISPTKKLIYYLKNWSNFFK
jgi:hypothetical protein